MDTFFLSWQNFNFGLAMLILGAYVLIDGMYAYYVVAVSEKRALRSATVGALMHFLIAFGVLNYVENYLYIVPLVIGSWIGTYIVVKRS